MYGVAFYGSGMGESRLVNNLKSVKEIQKNRQSRVKNIELTKIKSKSKEKGKTDKTL